MAETVRVKNALREIEPLFNTSFPRNIIEVCEKLDIKVQETSSFPMDVSGIIHKKNGNFYILINSNQSAGRKSFTIAHELGHFYLHKDRLESGEEIVSGAKGIDLESPVLARQDITAQSSSEYRKMESEANQFAASALMPENEFLKQCMKLDSIDDVARYFGVSISAAAIRADRIGGLYFL